MRATRFKPRLLLRVFSMVAASVGLVSLAIYAISVPLIKNTAYEIELNASRTILDNVFEMASRIQFNLEAQRELAINTHKQRLKNIVSLASAYVNFTFGRAERGEITEDEARRLVYDGIRTFTYGNDDYVWITNHDSVLVSHPDPAFQGRDASDVRDPSGEAILPTIIDIARRRGEGFHEYTWSRLGQNVPRYKLSYFRDFPKWGFVLGSGVYLDDIEEEVARRKAAAVSELRQALRSIRIARTGYVYIFDSDDHMIIHPNPNIEGTRFGELLNPVNGRPIAAVLREAAGAEHPIYYKWDKPDDPGNYTYEKLSWVRHFEGFDWYIASSVYVDELRRSSEILGRRILMIAAASMVVACALGYVVARRLIQPLKGLTVTAERVEAGDLSAESGIHRDDEIGLLAHTFDGMIRRMRDLVTNLDASVRVRTAELEEAQSALMEAEARQRLIMDAIPAAIAYADRDLALRFVNDGWAQLLAQPKEALIGARLDHAVGRRAADFLTPHIERALAGEERGFEYAFIAVGGREMITKNVLIPDVAPDGTVAGLFLLSLDITDEKAAEQQLMEAQRLKAVGQLSGGLAHDFNNLLSVIIGNLLRAQDKFAGVDGLPRFLAAAERAARRGADITNRLLAFARQQPLAPAAVDARALVVETGYLLQRSMPATITLELPAEEGPPLWAFVDAGQLANALVNLGLNARDAMAEDGAITFQVVGREVSDDAPLTLDEPVPPGRMVEITVTDGGCGFDPDTLARAFEPFFTTKALGSGLGLSMVYGFVKQSKGYIHIDSAPGRGTAVTLLLPGSAPPGEIEADGARPIDPPTAWNDALALLVEDDDDVRETMRGQLIDLGFRVIEAADGDEAMALLDGVEEVALMVSDIVMPGTLDGVALAAKVRRERPEIGVVLVSGYADTERLAADAPNLPILRKPWDRADLVAAIARSFHSGGKQP